MESLDYGISTVLASLRRDLNTQRSPLCSLPCELLIDTTFYLTSEANVISMTHVSHRL